LTLAQDGRQERVHVSKCACGGREGMCVAPPCAIQIASPNKQYVRLRGRKGGQEFRSIILEAKTLGVNAARPSRSHKSHHTCPSPPTAAPPMTTWPAYQHTCDTEAGRGRQGPRRCRWMRDAGERRAALTRRSLVVAFLASDRRVHCCGCKGRDGVGISGEPWEGWAHQDGRPVEMECFAMQ